MNTVDSSSNPTPNPTPNHAPPKLTTNQKALRISLNPARYGSFAEIGAGQEVACWFLRWAERGGHFQIHVGV